MSNVTAHRDVITTVSNTYQITEQATPRLTGAGAVGRKIVHEQTAVKLSYRIKDLEFYLPPTVIAALPDKMTVDELMTQLNALPDSTAPLTISVGTSISSSSSSEAKRERKSETIGSDGVQPPHSAPTVALPPRFDVPTVIDQFLQQDEDLLLLLGEAGAGKSLSTWQATQSLLAKFQLNMDGSQISQSWLPIHIDLNEFSLSDLIGLIDSQLKVYGLNDAEINKLKFPKMDQSAEPKVTAEPKTLLLLDGYDELRQEAKSNRREHMDLFKRIGGKTWPKGQLKVLVTCRRRYLPDSSEEHMIFGVGQSQHYQRFELLPFTMEQVERYISDRSRKNVGSNLLKPERYIETIKASESLKKLVSNPFVLRLFLEVLPRLVQREQDIQHITRFNLYSEFFDQWIEREVRRLSTTKKEALGRDTDAALVKDFKRLARYLALSMYARGTTAATFVEPSQPTPEYQVWDLLLDQLDKEANAEFEKLDEAQKKIAQQARFGAKPTSLNKETFLTQAQARANQLTDILPLRNNGMSQEFVHRSFYEYLVTAAIVDLTNNDPTFEAAALEFLKQRLIQTEPAIVEFLAELATQSKTTDQKPYAALRPKLFEIIQRSAKDIELGQASSNAATILNACHEPLSYQSWADVQLPGADLSYCVLAHSDLSGANLRRANLAHVVCCHTNLSGADLRDVSWGEYPYLPQSEEVDAIAHHPKRPWLAITQGHKVVLMDYDKGDSIGTMVGHTQDVTSVAFNSDGTHLVSGSKDRTVRLWEVVSQTSFGEVMHGHTKKVASVAFSRDGLYLASGSEDNTIHLWDAKTQKLLEVMKDNRMGYVRSVAFNKDGSYLAAGSSNNSVFLWDVRSKRLLSSTTKYYNKSSHVNSVVFSKNGLFLASGNADKTIYLWKVSNQALVPLGDAMTGHTDSISSVAFSPDDLHLASGSRDKTVRLWNVKNQTPLGIAINGHTEAVRSVAFNFNRDEPRLVSGSADKTVRLWNISNQIPLGVAIDGHRNSVTSVTFSPDGLRLASGSWDHTVRLWDVESQTSLGGVMRGHTAPVTSVAFNPVNGPCLASGSADYTVCVWDANSQTQLGGALLGHMDYVLSIAFSPDGLRLASGSLDKTVRLWDVNSEIRRLEIGVSHARGVESITFSPASCLLAFGSRDGTIGLWDIGCKKLLARLTGHTNYVTSVAFSPDGARLASGSADKTVRLWDSKKQVSLDALHGPKERVTSVAFNSDGSILAAGSCDHTVHLWKLSADGASICSTVLPWHQSINSVAFAHCNEQHTTSSVGEVKSSIATSTLSSRLGSATEDTLAIGDEAGTISFWAVARKDASLRFIGMPKHSGMPLLFNGAQLSRCKMNAISKRLLEQHGGDVDRVKVISESTGSLSETKDSKTSSLTTASTSSISFSIRNNDISPLSQTSTKSSSIVSGATGNMVAETLEMDISSTVAGPKIGASKRKAINLKSTDEKESAEGNSSPTADPKRSKVHTVSSAKTSNLPHSNISSSLTSSSSSSLFSNTGYHVTGSNSSNAASGPLYSTSSTKISLPMQKNSHNSQIDNLLDEVSNLLEQAYPPGDMVNKNTRRVYLLQLSEFQQRRGSLTLDDHAVLEQLQTKLQRQQQQVVTMDISGKN